MSTDHAVTSTKQPRTPRRTTVPAPTTQADSPALDTLTGADTPALAGGSAVWRLERHEVDPASLVLDVNVRKDLQITPAFRALIVEHGVLVPVLVRVDPLGHLLVVDGQRRTVVALELGLSRIPVALLPPVGDEETRIVDQLVANKGGAALTDVEQIVAFEQLSLMGRPAATIARRVAEPLEVVETALRVSSSKAAAKFLTARPDATLDQLAAIAEFEDDKTAVTALSGQLVDPGRFRHVLQGLRDDRDRAAVVAEAVRDLPEGSVVLAERPSYSGTAVLDVDSLLDKPGGKRLTAQSHVDCPGHAVFVRAITRWQDGAPRGFKAEVTAFCTSWKSAGHVNRHAAPGSGATSGPQGEDQKAQRRALIANNKAAESAVVVRLEFIRELLKRPKLPADAMSHVAAALYLGRTQQADHLLARGLLYGKDLSEADLLADMSRPDVAQRYLLALALAHVEQSMPKDFWRQDYSVVDRVGHLRRLASWGYVLSDVEQLALDRHYGKGKKR